VRGVAVLDVPGQVTFGSIQDMSVHFLAKEKTIRAADAKEVGVGNPAEETYRYPNQIQRPS
jgi:hypothetical protein